MAPTLQRNKAGLGLLDLPPEVRHDIYRHLFCHKPTPITLGLQDSLPHWDHFYDSDSEEPPDPIFYTALFRVNKAISHDALQFAYASNSFRFDNEIETFCRLGVTALNSIRTLRVYKNAWLDSSYATAFWQTLNQSCGGLELLIIEAASHVLLGAIPRFKDFMASIPAGQSRPKLILDLTVLDRHFSFDIPEREYQSALEELHGSMKGPGRTLSPAALQYKSVMRLPRHVKEVRVVVDIGAGAFKALQEILGKSNNLGFVRSKDIASVACDGTEGRGERHCFTWQGDDNNMKV